MDEMFEIAQQTKYRFLGVSEMYKIWDGWNVWNRSSFCSVWIWILQNLRCLSCKSTNFVLLVKSTLISFFWLFGLCVCVLLLGMYESSYSIIGLYTLLLRYERDIRNFALSPLCLPYMKFLMPSVKKLGCKRCIGWKW